MFQRAMDDKFSNSQRKGTINPNNRTTSTLAKQSTFTINSNGKGALSVAPATNSESSRPGPAKQFSASSVNSLQSRVPSSQTSSDKPGPTNKRIPSSSLGKRSAGSQDAFFRTFNSDSAFSDEHAKPIEAQTTKLDALHQAVCFDDLLDDDITAEDIDEALGRPTVQKQTIAAQEKVVRRRSPSPGAEAWKRQFLISPESSNTKDRDGPKDITNIQSSAPLPWSSSPVPVPAKSYSKIDSRMKPFIPPTQKSEPAVKKRRTLPWQTAQEPETTKFSSAMHPPGRANAQETPKPKAKTQIWEQTASVVKAAQKDLKGIAQQKRALSTTSIGATSTEAPKAGRRSNRPTKHYMSEEQSHVLDMVVNEGKSVFFTGSAGTGKSVLLREIITGLRKKFHKDHDRVAVTASTGLAACNIGGVTLHSFAGIGLGKEDVERLVKKVRRTAKSKQRWLRTKVLIIDEISMVDGDLFDKLEGVARIMKNNGRPFGGIQLIVTGDFFQLPPVPDGGKAASFAFEANTWNNCVDHTILLTHIFRQKDPVFAAMLNEMRLGALSPDSVASFRKLNREIKWEDGLQATELFPTRREVENANNAQLRRIVGDSEVYNAMDDAAKLDQQQKEKLLSNCMAPATLELKRGAQVMLVKNLDDTLVNGSLGRIVGFMSEKTYAMQTEDGDDDLLIATPDEIEDARSTTKLKLLQDQFARDNSKTSTAKKYPLVQWSIADGTQRRTLIMPESWKFELPTGEVQASRKQLPLILAWAISIHKAQGQTLDRVKVDLNKVFEKGQAYVALSRATSQEGLQVLNFDPRKVMAHEKVRVFYRSLTSAELAKKGDNVASTSASAAGKKQTKINEFSLLDDDDDEFLEELEMQTSARGKLGKYTFG